MHAVVSTEKMHVRKFMVRFTLDWLKKNQASDSQDHWSAMRAEIVIFGGILLEFYENRCNCLQF